METNAFDKLERLFRAARLLHGTERGAFIEAACQDDDGLRSELESLLAADEGAEEASFLNVTKGAIEVLEQPMSLEGQQIGPYKLIEPLGAGGMGEVWLGEQKEPIKRQVAFKLIKLGMDTKEVVARFDSERQALAVMDHPNIAKVYDAGITATGRSYFVMELVRGIPVNEYCDAKRLSTGDRIRLFMDICRAVQHAHQKGVIHRDLKPTNVLIAEHDDKPVPKVIDFGIAKAVGYNLTAHTLVTGMGQLIGTPAYMSPEQAEMKGLDIDTRTDVYSLGVMLYELLVGSRPLDLKEKAQHAIKEAIRDSQVPKPSTRLTSLGNQQQSIADQRQTTPDQLRRELKGDLDWIVLKSIEKDRSRRYDTVNGLAMELERYLGNQPVMARPPSLRYRTQKFIRRNQTVVVAGLLVFFALIGGIAAATVGLVRAQKAEQVAQQEALTSQSVSDFLVQLFEVSDPGVARGNSITAREILDQGAERIEVELKDQPNVRAKLLHTMGKVYWELGLEDESMDLLREAIDLRKATLGDDHADVAESMRALATTLSGHFGAIMPDQREEILSLLHEARAIHEEQLGPAHPEVAEDWASIAVFTMDRLMQEDPAEYEQAIIAGKKALDIWTEAYGVDDPRLHKMLYKLGGWYRDWNKDYETAAGYYARSAAIIESNYGPESGLMMEPLYGLYRMEYQKDFRSAETINAFNRMWGVSDEEIINSDANPSLFITTASFLQSTGHLKEAEDALERAARLLEKKYGADVEDMVFAHARLIQLYIPQERWTEIEEKAKWTRPIWEQNGSRTNVANTFYYAGLAQVALGRLDEAEHSFLEALSVYEEISTRFDLPTVLWELGRVYRLQGKTQQADAVEKRMRTAAFASTQGERTRAANDRFYAMALLNCREQWKIRTVMYDCYSAPFDKVAGLTHAQKAYDDSPDSMHNLVVLALAHHFSGNNEDAIRFINEAITKVHEASPTMKNLQYWLKKINSTPDSH